MGTLLVSDTSVLIDLERGRTLAALFRLPFDVAGWAPSSPIQCT